MTRFISKLMLIFLPFCSTAFAPGGGEGVSAGVGDVEQAADLNARVGLSTSAAFVGSTDNTAIARRCNARGGGDAGVESTLPAILGDGPAENLAAGFKAELAEIGNPAGTAR